MLPVGGSIAYLMWFNSYLEQVGTDLRYGLFDFTFIKFPMWLVLVASIKTPVFVLNTGVSE